MPLRPRRTALAGLAAVVAFGAVQVSRDDSAMGAAATVPLPLETQASTAPAAPPPSAAPTPRPPATRGTRKPVAKRVPAPALCFGAAAMKRSDCPRGLAPVVPWGRSAWEDRGPAYDHDCVTKTPWPPSEGYSRCVYFGGKRKADVALVGNSHAVQYLPAVLALAAKNDWRLTTYLATKCFPTAIRLAFPGRQQDNCRAWGQWVLQDTKDRRFDLVITSNRQTAAPVGVSRAKGHPLWKKGYAHYIENWLDVGTRVLVIRDNPYPRRTRTTVPDCVATHPRDFRPCSAARTAWLTPDPLAAAARAADSRRARVADLTSLFCTSVCLPVIGGVLVYRDDSHLTGTFARTLAPYLEPHIARALAVE